MHQTTENYSPHKGVPQEITLLNKAHATLMEACTVDEVRDVRDRAEAVRSYARKARLGREILIEAAALRLRSERRLGQLLQQLPLAKGAPGNQYTTNSANHEQPEQIRLQDVGITKSDSSRLQRIAAVPEDRFQAYIKESVAASRECSTAACLRLLGPRRKTKKKTSSQTNASPALRQLATASTQFAALFARPFGTGAESSQAIGVDELSRQPVAELCEPDGHLYLLIPVTRLTDALQVMESWGFQYAFCLPWLADDAPQSNVLPFSQELLLAGRRGNLPFAELHHAEWNTLVQDGYRHETLTCLIQQLSPGPYLDLTSNSAPWNERWTTVHATEATQ